MDADGSWEVKHLVPSAEVLWRISSRWPLAPMGGTSSPPTTFRFADGAPGRIGVVTSVTEPFCDRCNRLRLTAGGKLLTCLIALEEVDAPGLLCAGATDDEVARLS